MLISYKRGQGSIILRCKIRDSSVSTGAGLTGLAYNSTGLRVSTIADNEASATVYTVAGSTLETITTLGTYAAPTATKARIKQVDATNHPGIYELHIDDSRFSASNAKSLLVSISGATNAAECYFVVPLVDVDPYSVTAAATALLDLSSGIETGVTLRQAIQRIGAVVAGNVSGAGTSSEIFVGLDGSTVRATDTADASGNRSWVYM